MSRCCEASAEHLPFPADAFDAALAQLVVHFMADPVAGLAEMARVTRRGGVVAACVWDHAGGHGPLSLFWQAARELDPEVHDESQLAGAREGHLAELFEAAGCARSRRPRFQRPSSTRRSRMVGAVHRGVGPAGSYVAGLDADTPSRAAGALPESAAGPTVRGSGSGLGRPRPRIDGGRPGNRREARRLPCFGILGLVGVHRLDATEARRIAVRAQILDAPRPTDLLAVVRQLTLLQIDPTAAVAPNADLVAWSRLGSSYQPAQLQQALEQDRTLFELDAMVRPMSDLGLFLAAMATSPSYETSREWLRLNDRFRRDILDLVGTSGPLLSRDIPDTSAVPWQSSGWTGNRNVTQMLEFLMMRGEVAIAGRRGRQRLWDLAERVYPPDTPGRPGRRGSPRAERAAVAVVGHRTREADRRPPRTVGCWRRGRAGDGRGRAR